MKKTITVILSLLLIISSLSVIPFAAQALEPSGQCGPYITYTFDSSTGTLSLDGGGQMYDYAWGESPFFGNTDIKTLVVIDEITKTPGPVSGYVETIGSNAFAQCTNLETVVLPSSVAWIGESAFNGCTKLKNLTLARSTGWIGERAFAGCAALTEIELRKGMTVVKAGVFDGCTSLKTITVSGTVKTVEDGAFYGCTALTDVYYWGTDAEWDAINVGTGNSYLKTTAVHHYEEGACGENVNYHMDFNTGVMTISGTGAMDNYDPGVYSPWDQYKARITQLVVKRGVTDIGNLSFHNCYYLTSIYFPFTLDKIGDDAFTYCTGLTDIYYPFPESMYKTLDKGRDITPYFYYDATKHFNYTAVVESGSCGENATYKLDENGLLTISGTGDMTDFDPESPFEGNTDIKSVIIESGITSVGDMSFNGCSGITYVSLGDTVTRIGKNAFKDCDGLESLTMPDSVTVIDNLAFSGSNKLSSVTFSKNLSSIGNYAFDGCKALTALTVPASVETVGNYAFRYCSALTGLVIEDGVKTLGDYAFMGCTGLTKVTAPDSVTAISQRAFAGCTALTEAHIGKGVTTIGSNVFQNDSNLTDIYYNGSAEDWDAIDIGSPNKVLNEATKHFDTTIIKTGTCGEGAKWTFNTQTGVLKVSGTGKMTDYSGEYDFPSYYEYREQISSVEVQSGITYIGIDAFRNLSNAASATIAETVTEIAAGGFFGCEGLDTVTIPASVTAIGENAFALCSVLDTVNYGGDKAQWDAVSIAAGNEPLLAIMPQTPALIEGTCGENANWSLVTATGVLTVSGTGAMADYNLDYPEFYQYRDLITSIVIENGITYIGKYAFFALHSVETATVPESVTEIASSAFSNCFALKNITIGSGVKGIGEAAFYSCTGLAAVNYSGTEADWSLMDIGDYNEPLLAVKPQAGLLDSGSCGEGVTYSFDVSTRTLTISGTGAMTDFATRDSPFYAKGEIERVIIESGVTSIGNYAFRECGALKSVNIPLSVTNIGMAAFASSGLTDIYYEGTETQWGEVHINKVSNANVKAATMHYSSSLTVITGSCGENVNWSLDTVTGILTISGTGAMTDFATRDSPFYNNTGIKSVIIESGVTSIGNYAFRECGALKSVNIPLSVTNIGMAAFVSSGLTDIYYEGTETQWSEVHIKVSNANVKDATMHYSSGLTVITGSCGENVNWSLDTATGVMTISGIGPMDDYSEVRPEFYEYKDSITSIVVEEGVTEIGKFAFYDCENLESINIPDSVTAIGNRAFEGANEKMTVTASCNNALVPGIIEGTDRVWNKVHSHTEVRNAKEATATEDGYTGDTYCLDCGTLISAGAVIPATGGITPHTPGDINGDGSVNNKDLTRLFQYLSDWDVEVNEAALDVNGDEAVNNKDLTRLFQYLSDWDVEIF